MDNFININDIDIFMSTHKLDYENKYKYTEFFRDNYDIVMENDDLDFNKFYGNNFKECSFIEDTDCSDLINLLINKIKIVDYELFLKYSSEINDIKNLSDFYNFYIKIYKKFNKAFYQFNNDNYQYVLHEIIMLYHRRNAFNIMDKYAKNNNIKYDGIIIYRPDLFFTNKLILSEYDINDDTIYLRLDFMFISTYKGIYKLIYNFLDNFYIQNNTENYLKNIDVDTIKFWKYLLEFQHKIFIYDKNNYLNVYDILNDLNHYRCQKNNNNIKL